MRWVSVAALVLTACLALADGPQDNIPEKVRRVPPRGAAVPAAARQELTDGVQALGREIDALRTALKAKPALRELLPDVQIFHNAVRYALAYDEFFNIKDVTKDVAIARTLLKHGFDRAKQLRDGKPTWTTATGLVVRGYVSKIDGSVQPYGLVVPTSYQANTPHKFRLDFWCHGRGETLSEMSFLDQRMKNAGEFTPPNAFVLHLYGRYCNANRFAGEVDLFEAYDSVRKHYPIDENRRVIRGFSMGGAACWQFAVHYPGFWAAAAPGAGFSETLEFLNFFQNEKVKPTWYEEKLWHLYDCTDYAVNLFNCPTVAYSGEIDKQKQAADVMARELLKEGLTLTHVIGPKTAHKYHPEAKTEINRRIDSIVERGRNPVPHHVKFTTWTLRYNQCLWLQVDGLDRHWKRATVDAELAPFAPTGPVKGRKEFGGRMILTVEATNVSALTIAFPAGHCSLDASKKPGLRLNGQFITNVPSVLTDRSWTAHVRKIDGQWKAVAMTDDGTLAKRHGLQGPIDDAFMDRFVMVRPTGKPHSEKVGKWAAGELAHAVEHWRRQFRGEALVKDDTDVTDADIATSNLILWGDPGSNKVLAKIAARLPIAWDGQGVRLGKNTYAAEHHVPVLIYPNPLNPKKYVVVNSGITYREYDYLNNARQVPKLPDWAILDVNQPTTSRHAAGVVTAGFFDERWQWVAPR